MALAFANCNEHVAEANIFAPTYTQRALHGTRISRVKSGKITLFSRSGYTRACHRNFLFPEYRIGGDGDYCGDSDAQLGCINVFYYEASGGKYVPRAVFFDLEPGVIGAVRAPPLGELFRPGKLVNHTRGQK